MHKKRLGKIALIVGLILLIPLCGTWFADGWNWDPVDFLAIGLLLFGTGILIDLAVRKIEHPIKRLIAILTLIGFLFLMWGEIAVHAVSKALSLVF